MQVALILWLALVALAILLFVIMGVTGAVMIMALSIFSLVFGLFFLVMWINCLKRSSCFCKLAWCYSCVSELEIEQRLNSMFP